ncbi:Lactate utilization protein C [Anatilimnocola aggregata]|uniref:Lactate utilization protein C n=1 Tax=Anatilimnocola aggregata TaxID=2528021 RepID=A0A517YH93_9BACT|nr:lactate utilization protein [Anatilimnocola aggregata]QDU29579.1 Lactate utilization protein C [Anatilimnocola aggregata]
MAREAFLARVKQAAEIGRAYRVEHQQLAPDVGYVGVTGDACAKLAQEIDAVGGIATIVDSLGQAREILAGYLLEAEAKTALCWQHPLLMRLQLNELLAERNVTRVDYDSANSLTQPARRLEQLACEIGITSVDLAIAETGTLLMCHHPGQERLASLLPPVHVAIVEQSQIVPDLLDAFRILHERGVQNLPSNITLITGPSKTGDIELQLTTGVHGPGRWRVIIIR